MNNEKTLISIIIPTFNSEHYIKEAVNSALNQSYRNLEIIVVDDGSTDNTQQELSRFIKDGRIKYFHKKNGGPASARNKGMMEASGDFIAFLDADDVWCDREKILKQLDFLKKNKGHGFVGTNEIAVNSFGKEFKSVKKIEDVNIRQTILLHCEFTQSSVLMRKSVIEKVGYFNESGLYMAVEDYEYWLRIGRNFKFGNLPDYCVKYRIGIGISNKNIFRRRIAILRMIFENTGYYPNSIVSIIKHCLIFFVPGKLVLLKQAKFNYVKQ